MDYGTYLISYLAILITSKGNVGSLISDLVS